MRRLRHSLLILWLVAATAPAGAQDKSPISPADQAAIHKVVQSQLEAFQKDDGATAFSFATPDLRQRFQTVENFMAMVRDRYPAVYRPSQVTFGALENSDGSIIQHVLVVGPDGNLHEALYFMERQKDGTWLIGGCLLIESDLKSS